MDSKREPLPSRPAPGKMTTDLDLDALRPRPDFQALLKELEAMKPEPPKEPK